VSHAQTLETLRANPKTWLVTGCAGFIGSHLLEALLNLGQPVVGLDNFSTGSPRNLEDVKARVPAAAWARFNLLTGTVQDPALCRAACNGVDYILHEAGFISVPLSLEDPLACNETNVTGTLTLLMAAREHRVKRFVYASSSAVYGDDATMPKVEEKTGSPLSPYGASKFIDEIYAATFWNCHALETVGLRYFNVFGSRQNPKGGYAAVIPAWVSALVEGRECVINGDGGITRDFVHIDNVVQANLLAATTQNAEAFGTAFNVGNGGQTTLEDLYKMIAAKLGATRPVKTGAPRAGDILHSGADIAKARRVLGYEPAVTVDTGLTGTVKWYAENPEWFA
jgi:UDP-N-acetylglucosamine 4-epimerase